MHTLTLSELGTFLAQHYHRDVLRVETRQNYLNESEEDGLRRYLHGEPAPEGTGDTPWTHQLRAHAAAGRTWRVLHAVTYPLTAYLRYECEWGYVHNAAAGQEIRIDQWHDEYGALGDLLIIDHEHVFRYTYDAKGVFISAQQLTGGERDEVLTLAETLWAEAKPFADWWAAHPQYHRTTAAA